MNPSSLTVFDLPDRLAAKADSALIAEDEAHFARIAATLEEAVSSASSRLDAVLHSPAGVGGAAVERDLEIHRLNARLGMLRRYGVDLCLGKMTPDSGEPVYIGRTGLTDAEGEALLVDWRTPAAEPFFAASHGAPMGLVSRRRYRWTGRRITDYWDEVFTADGLRNRAALDDQSAFIASLGASRSPRMRDVLATIQADQDAIIRAGGDGALVVDGGPGTGKTVVALHRAAYLLYAEPRIAAGSGGVLVVGPHQPYLSYVEDVLPSLGEEGVRTCTLRDLVPEGAEALAEPDPHRAALKADARLLDAVATAVRLYRRPPQDRMLVETEWADIPLDPEDWADAFDAVEPGTAHDDARPDIWRALVEILARRARVPQRVLAPALAANDRLGRAFERAWPLLDPTALTAALFSDAAFLRRCAPWLPAAEVDALVRAEDAAWTVSDLPFLDAARRLVGDPSAERVRRERAAQLTAERAYREDIADYLIASSDDDLGLMSMLRGDDLRNSLDDLDALPDVSSAPLDGPFAHIVVDEAQELTDAEWRMLLERCPSRSFTIVGDRAQARHGFTDTWEARLARAGLGEVRMASLTVNYRTPSEIMAEAEPVIRAAIPDANVPRSIRSGGVPVHHGALRERDAILTSWLAGNEDGTAAVIGIDPGPTPPRVLSLTPETAKGLEFDLVVLLDPDGWGDGVEGAVDRYVAMTRSTRELVVLRPDALTRAG
ncbi:RNA polymerase recycling motor ATPase HelR [Microbacterium sp. CIAB417]|uniref:RNA polymerase recycling motor ATPase HelR n=1 Tax=Microbacterium sp. CIAB417 TaxID=2860287 RepID=UPI001FACABC3|nr:RNA polymerase recycling motor ATPase HelR [Microbacterium sp. CIAB417]